MALSGSVYTTVALTVERYISVVVPFFRQRHNLKAWVFIVPVAIFVIAYSIPRFFEVETVYVCEVQCSNSTAGLNCTEEWKAQMNVTKLRKNPYYVQV